MSLLWEAEARELLLLSAHERHCYSALKKEVNQLSYAPRSKKPSHARVVNQMFCVKLCTTNWCLQPTSCTTSSHLVHQTRTCCTTCWLINSTEPTCWLTCWALTSPEPNKLYNLLGAGLARAQQVRW
jgi:hypothetical protein